MRRLVGEVSLLRGLSAGVHWAVGAAIGPVLASMFGALPVSNSWLRLPVTTLPAAEEEAPPATRQVAQRLAGSSPSTRSWGSSSAQRRLVAAVCT